MRSLVELEAIFDEPMSTPDACAAAERLLLASEEVLEHWVTARAPGTTPVSMPVVKLAVRSFITTIW